jgi:hypothetical protein
MPLRTNIVMPTPLISLYAIPALSIYLAMPHIRANIATVRREEIMSEPDDDLKFPEWLDDALLDALARLNFNTDISWDSRGRITLHIWKMSEAEKADIELWKRMLKGIEKVTRGL